MTTGQFTPIRLQWCAWRWGAWFRVRGWGLMAAKIDRDFIPLFSERYGFRKAWYLGRIRFEVLRPRK